LSQDGPKGAGGKCFGSMDGNGNRPGMARLDHLIVSAADPVHIEAQALQNANHLFAIEGRIAGHGD